MCITFPQLRKIVRHVRSSPQRRKKWMDIVARSPDDSGKKPLMLILDVKTRWSSTHQMLRESIFTAFPSCLLIVYTRLQDVL
jgi:hypothetical protein